jgi:uncharacterized protein YbjT (DUF2867 family)
MNTAIVIGATGLVGKALIGLLVKEKRIKKIVAVTRRPIEYSSNKVINEVVDFDALEKYRDVFKGHILFSCMGTTAKQAGSTKEQRKVDFDYQYQAAKISSENGVGHYILVSSSGANAKSLSPYLKMKGELENEISLLPFKRISILQPSLLIGERESFRLGETLASWSLPVVCRLPLLKRYRPISGSDVAKKMVLISLTSGCCKEVFTLDEIFS